MHACVQWAPSPPTPAHPSSPTQLLVLPPVEELQTAPATRGKWIKYAALDAKATHDLRAALEAHLRATPVRPDPALARHLAVGRPGYSMWDLYVDYWLPFGELLTDMEARGVRVDRCVGAEGRRGAGRRPCPRPSVRVRTPPLVLAECRRPPLALESLKRGP